MSLLSNIVTKARQNLNIFTNSKKPEVTGEDLKLQTPLPSADLKKKSFSSQDVYKPSFENILSGMVKKENAITSYPKKTKQFFEETKKFGARTAVNFADIVSEGLDFSANFTANRLIDSPLIGTGTKTFFSPEKSKELKTRWQSFYNEQLEKGNVPTRKLKLAVDKLEEKEFLQPSKEWTEAPIKDKLTKHLGETLLNIGPSIVSSVGAFAINPTLGLSAIVSSTSNDVTEDAIKYGVKRDKAELLGLSTGILVGLLERIVPSRIFVSGGIKNKFIGSFAKRLANSAILETGTEIAQEDIQLIAEKTFRDDLGWDEVVSRNALAGLGGLLGGAGMQTIATLANKTQREEILGALKEMPLGLSVQDVNKRVRILEAKEKLSPKEQAELNQLKQLKSLEISPAIQPLAEEARKIPPSELKLEKNIKEAGGYRNYIVDKATGKKLVDTTTSPAFENDILKNGLDPSLAHFPENLPLRTSVKEPAPISTQPQNQFKVVGLNEKTRQPDRSEYIVKFPKSKATGKISVGKYIVLENGEENFVDEMTLEKAQERYQNKDPEIIANRIINPFVNYNYQTEKYQEKIRPPVRPETKPEEEFRPEVKLGKLTDAEARTVFQESTIQTTTSKYKFDTIEKAVDFIKIESDKPRRSDVLNADFVVNDLTRKHLFGEERSEKDKLRRAKLFGPGLEIIENRGVLAGIDKVTDEKKGIVYYEIVGTDGESLIRAKVSEQNKNGKVFFTVSDISGGAPVPATPSSGRSLGRLTTSDIDIVNISEAIPSVKPPSGPRPPSMRDLGIEPPLAPKITRREDILLRERLRAEARGAKGAAIEGRRKSKIQVAETKAIEREKAKQTVSELRENKTQELKEYKENLKNRQKEALELLDKLPSELQGRMKEAITRTTTRKRVFDLSERIKSRIKALIERQGIREAGELVKTAKTAEITPKYQRLIADLVKDYDFKKPTKATVKRLKATREFLQENPDYLIPEKYIEEIRRLEKTNLRDLSIGDVKKFNQTIRNLIRIGEEIQKHRVIVNRLKFKNELSRALVSANNLDSENDNLNRIYETENNFEFTFRVADKTDGSQLYKGWHAEFVKGMGQKVNEAEIEQATRIFNFFQEHAKITNLTLSEIEQKEVAAHLYNDQGGTEQTGKILKDLGIDVLPELSDEQKKIKDLLVKTAKQKTEQIQPLWETTMVDENGRPMAFEVQENYFPFYYEEEGSDLGVYSILQDYKAQSRIKFGAGFSRKAGVDLTPKTDIYKMLQEAVAKQELFLNLQPQLFEKGTIFRTKDYQTKAGKLNSKYWVGYIDEMSRNGMSSNAIRTPMDGWLRKGRQNISRGLLDLSFTSTAIQPFAIFDAMGYMATYMPKSTVFKLAGNFIQMFIRPNFAKKTIEQSKALITRKGGEEVIQSFDQGKVKKRKILAENVWTKIWRTISRPFALLRFFDLRTAASVQKTAVVELSKTMSLEAAQAEADFIMDLLSGSSNLAYRPRIMNQGELGRAITTFQTFILNEWGLITQDIIKKGLIKGGPNRDIQTRLWALTGIMFLFLQGYLENWARNKITNKMKGTDYENDSFLKSSLLYLPERVPILGSIFKGVSYGRTGLPAPLFDVVVNAIKGVYGTFTAKEEKTKLKHLSKVVEAVAVLFGIPAKEAQNFVERLIEGSDIGEKSIKSIRKDILKQIKSGEISVSVAKENLKKELKSLERSKQKEVFELSPEDYRKNLFKRIEEKEITLQESREELVEYLEKNKEKAFESFNEAGFIDKVKIYAQAFGTDPVTFFGFIFSGEEIKKLRGGTIIVERLPFEESQEIKKERGADKDMILDHTIPLILGGNNSDKNLKLVSRKEWERYTPIEIYLGNALEDKLLTREKAQDLIRNFKEGKITEDDIYSSITVK